MRYRVLWGAAQRARLVALVPSVPGPDDNTLVTKDWQGRQTECVVRHTACPLRCANNYRKCGECIGAPCVDGSYLVDPASSHMLVSKIKPCMSKYKCVYRETARAHYTSYRLFDGLFTRIPLVILELILAQGGASASRIY